ncbi:hypothetical protein LTR27_005362 [Elasticomyces elasticus]|nr:hypothetical protein LTR27_005362 [Elasticomyces elasticus]
MVALSVSTRRPSVLRAVEEEDSGVDVVVVAEDTLVEARAAMAEDRAATEVVVEEEGKQVSLS